MARVSSKDLRSVPSPQRQWSQDLPRLTSPPLKGKEGLRQTQIAKLKVAMDCIPHLIPNLKLLKLKTHRVNKLSWAQEVGEPLQEARLPEWMLNLSG